MFHKDRRLDSQNVHRLDVIVQVCNPSIPVVRWEEKTGESLGAHVLTTLVYTGEQQETLVSNTVEGEI